MNLAVKKREVFWKALNAHRKLWQVPWIIYSRHHETSIPVFFEKLAFIKLYEKAGQSSPVTLKWDWIEELVLIHDIDLDPVSDRVRHVDFHAVKADEKTQAEVPVVLAWEAPVEKLWLWKVELIKDHVLVEALPMDLPHDIQIDISKLETAHDVIFVKDLNVSSKVKLVDDNNLPVVTVVEIADESDEASETAEDSEKTE